MNKDKMLGEENISKLLYKLSLPAIAGMMLNALYNVVDTIFVGKGVGDIAIGALTVAMPIQFIFMAISLMVGIGVATNISICFGKGQLKDATIFIGTGYVFIGIVFLVITLIGLLFTTPLLAAFGASPEVLPYAVNYMQIILVGSIFMALTMVNTNIFRASGHAVLAMLTMLVGTLLNIALDPIFIFTLNLGIRGAAYATVISQFTSFLISMILIVKGRAVVKISLKALNINAVYAFKILTLGFPSFLRQISTGIVGILLNKSIVVYGGDLALTSFGIINRVMMFVMMPMFGLIQGIQPIIGFNYGAKKIDRIREVIKIGLMTISFYGGFIFLAILIFKKPIFYLFTNSQQVIDIGMTAINIMFLGLPVIGLQVIASSFFQSIGKSLPAMFLSLLRQTILLLPLIILLPKVFNLGLLGIFIAYPISDITSSIISHLMLKKEMRQFLLKA